MYHATTVSFSQTSGYGSLEVKISCRELNWQVSSLEQVCTSCFPSFLERRISTSTRTHIRNHIGKDNIENSFWLELLHPFTVLKSFHLSKEFVPRIAPALQELVGSRTTEVLPTLQNILLEDSSHWNLSKKALRNPLLLCFPLEKIKRPPLSKYRTILVSCCLLTTWP